MKHTTIKNLESLKGKIKMTSDQKNDVEDILFSKISNDLFVEKDYSVDLLTRMANALIPTFNLKPVGVFVMILSLVLGSSFGTVSASKNTLPGDILYPVKITAENFEYTLAFSNEKKVEVAIQSIENRMDELKRMAVENTESVHIAVASENLKDNLNKVQVAVQEVNQEEVIQTADQNLMEIENEIREVAENSEILGQDAQEIKNEVEKTTSVILSVLINSNENNENEVKEIKINEQELKDRIAEKINNVTENLENAEELKQIKENLADGNLKLAIDGLLTLNNKEEIIENETTIVAGEVKGEEVTASTTQINLAENENSSSTQTMLFVPVSIINILGIEDEEEVSQEFNVGLK